VPSRLAELIRKARRLAAERDKLIDASRPVGRARSVSGLSAATSTSCEAGLIEEAVRRGGPPR